MFAFFIQIYVYSSNQTIFKVQEQLFIYTVSVFYSHSCLQQRVLLRFQATYLKTNPRNVVQGSLQIKLYFFIINGYTVVEQSSFLSVKHDCEHSFNMKQSHSQVFQSDTIVFPFPFLLLNVLSSQCFFPLIYLLELDVMLK